jgi:XTP/dITP diphosphohydrolase
VTEPAPGSRLLDLVAVMDQLRSPGGCPWDAEQTHHSLLQYLIEECYETVEAVETGDREHLREELGDLLLQVVFHARIAAEDPDAPFDIDDVAAGIANKLRRRHPHVFAGLAVSGTAEVEANWEALKAAEKGRSSAVDGVPLAQPALALAAKLQRRARSAGTGPVVPVAELPEDGDVGAALFALVATAVARGLDPEAELRRAAREFADAVRADEAQRRAGTDS